MAEGRQRSKACRKAMSGKLPVSRNPDS